MKKSYIRVSAWLASSCASLLGFFGCDVVGPGVEEYGTPYVSFSLKAEVKGNNQPIEGVLVEVLPDNGVWNSDQQKTDAQGGATVTGKMNHEEKYLKYRVADVDGGENGCWKEKVDSVWISLDDIKKTGKESRWENGRMVKSVQVELISENPQSER